MKPDAEANKTEEENVTGDVIGDTAYSERFVLKLLLKFANLDILKNELQEKIFEDDLCTLWDMTAERDVVLFLQKHDVFNLLNFAFPIIDSPRIIEILIGMIGNMCCQKEAAKELLKMNSFLTLLLEYAKSEDSLIIIQVLRLVNTSLFLAKEQELHKWIEIFIKIGYSNALYYVLRNSSNKDLLLTALENFNTICSYCNSGKDSTNFFGHFVTAEAIESLATAFTEITIKQKDSCETEELERVLIITLQITLNLVGFDKSYEVYNENKSDVLKIITQVFTYYENKFVNQKEIDMDLVDVIDSAITIVKELELSCMCGLEQFFQQSYSMWRTLSTIAESDKNGSSSFEIDDKEELQVFSTQMKVSLSNLIFNYMEKCGNKHLYKALDEIGTDFDDMSNLVKEKSLWKAVCDRASNYKTRLKETENC
ncbi:unnamed protein product, partial [Brenthis ino]